MFEKETLILWIILYIYVKTLNFYGIFSKEIMTD